MLSVACTRKADMRAACPGANATVWLAPLVENVGVCVCVAENKACRLFPAGTVLAKFHITDCAREWVFECTRDTVHVK